MKKTILVFAVALLLMSIPIVSAVSVQQQKKSIEKINKTQLYNKIVTTLKNKLNVNITVLQIIVLIFLTLYTIFVVIPVFILLAVAIVFHCFIWNPLKVIFELIYLELHPDVPPW